MRPVPPRIAYRAGLTAWAMHSAALDASVEPRMSDPDRRVIDARRALDAARDARERNHNPTTALAVASAQLRFDEARRAAARWDVT